MDGHPIFARIYPRIAAAAERAGQREHRIELLSDLRGRVLEVGAGHGPNFAHYPSAVTEVVAVEPDRRLRAGAARASRRAPVSVSVVDGLADDLPVGTGTVDAVVVALVLCTVADQGSALGEMRRVLRPGGELRFYEHVRSTSPRRARLQDQLDRAGLWPLVAGGCHCGRDTEAAIVSAGFAITAVRRFLFPSCLIAAPVAPHILGRATSAVPTAAP